MKSVVKRLAAGSLTALLMGLIAAPLYAQLPEHLRDYPLAPRKATGDIVAPMFNGWMKNDDGSVTLMFGFANQNREEIADIPHGPNNFIEPAEFDGIQPTHFPVYNYRGLVGIQERGAFTVTLLPEQADTEVVWTLSHNGHSYSVPGRTTSVAYEMSRDPRAFGSLSPAIRFDLNGTEATDIRDIVYAPRINASVGAPVTLSAYIQDRSGEREEYDVDPIYPLGTHWVMHQGPAMPDIADATITGRERAQEAGEGGAEAMTNGWTEVSTQATFSEPGDYIMRLRVDNFMAPDSQFDNLCCWTNAYIPVTVQ